METRIIDSNFWGFSISSEKTMNVVNNLGASAIFFTLSFLRIFRRKRFREIVQRVFYIGARSSNIVILVGLFTACYSGFSFSILLTNSVLRVLSSVVIYTHQGTGACTYCDHDNCVQALQ
jgi:ABC-type transporter Mla maintaining outer membrane lipid asymmetry permease subunit MlaE